MYRFLFTLAPFVLLAGCGNGTAVVDPTFSSIQQNIFEISCNSSACHGASPGAGNLDLTAGNAYNAMLSVAPDNADAQGDGYLLVDPGSPDNSYLYLVMDEASLPSYANLMPKQSAAVLAEDLDAVRQWISDGAAND